MDTARGHRGGQSFLKLFQSRFVPGGLYLMDEPEAPLSPQSQLALLAMIGDMVSQDAQFIIATHSRSEEHTSELQSRPHLVCRLLLEKKKTDVNYSYLNYCRGLFHVS